MKRTDLLKALIVGGTLALGVPSIVGAAEPVNESENVVQQAVNINTADAAELAASLKGVGTTKAQAIVEYREANGPFTSVDELANVKGIGPRSLEKLRPLIAI